MKWMNVELVFCISILRPLLFLTKGFTARLKEDVSRDGKQRILQGNASESHELQFSAEKRSELQASLCALDDTFKEILRRLAEKTADVERRLVSVESRLARNETMTSPPPQKQLNAPSPSKQLQARNASNAPRHSQRLLVRMTLLWIEALTAVTCVLMPFARAPLTSLVNKIRRLL